MISKKKFEIFIDNKGDLHILSMKEAKAILI
jgi:hypothetical protein